MFSAPWKIGTIAGGILALLMFIGLLYYKGQYESVSEKFATLSEQMTTIIVSIQEASGNDKVNVKTAAGQVYILGQDKKNIEMELAKTNSKLDEMAAEAVRLKEQNKVLQELANKARAQKEAALKELGDLTISPEKKRDCETLVREADRALDLLYKAGL